MKILLKEILHPIKCYTWKRTSAKRNLKKIFENTVCKKTYVSLLGKLLWIFNVMFVVTLFFSCNKNMKKNQDELTDSIVVAFYPYVFETSTPRTCKDMMSSATRVAHADTIMFYRDYFYRLKDSLKNLRINGKKTIDCRILIKSDGYNIGIDQFFNVVDENDNVVELSPKLIYTILKDIKYFNYFSTEDMEYSYVIEHFGLPEDYNYIPLKDSMKVIKEEGGFDYIPKPKSMRKTYIVPYN